MIFTKERNTVVSNARENMITRNFWNDGSMARTTAFEVLAQYRNTLKGGCVNKESIAGNVVGEQYIPQQEIFPLKSTTLTAITEITDQEI